MVILLVQEIFRINGESYTYTFSKSILGYYQLDP